MFESLDTALLLLEDFVASFDAAPLSRVQSREAFDKLSRVERLGAAGKAMAGLQVTESCAWYDTADRSPAHYMARTAGTTVGHAVDVLQTAESLKQLPETEQAFRRGQLSERQAIEVASAASADPDAEQMLLEAAGSESLVELRRRCSRVRAAAMSEEQKQSRAHRRRQLRHWTDIEGVFHLQGRFTPKAGGVVLAALEPFHQQVQLRAAGNGLKETAAAHLADALVEMAEQSRSGNPSGAPHRTGPGAVVHVRVDRSAMVRGHTEKGEICEIPGVGPIPVSAAKELAADSFLKAILVEGEDVLAVAHLGRTIPAHLRTALVERDQKCVVAGCDQLCCLEFDHVTEFRLGGVTSLKNLVRLCHWHHYLKTYHGYRLKRVKGKYWLLLDPLGLPGEAEPYQQVLPAAAAGHTGRRSGGSTPGRGAGATRSGRSLRRTDRR
jgi:hypothetical protein